MRLQLVLIELKVVSVESGSNDERQLHVGHVLADASARTIREGIEANLLSRAQSQPSVWLEFLHIGSPDVCIVVNGEAGNRQDSALGEVFLAVVNTLLGGDKTGKTNGGSRV